METFFTQAYSNQPRRKTFNFIIETTGPMWSGTGFILNEYYAGFIMYNYGSLFYVYCQPSNNSRLGTIQQIKTRYYNTDLTISQLNENGTVSYAHLYVRGYTVTLTLNAYRSGTYSGQLREHICHLNIGADERCAEGDMRLTAVANNYHNDYMDRNVTAGIQSDGGLYIDHTNNFSVNEIHIYTTGVTL